jgi:hypothetical protein
MFKIVFDLIGFGLIGMMFTGIMLEIYERLRPHKKYSETEKKDLRKAENKVVMIGTLSFIVVRGISMLVYK